MNWVVKEMIEGKRYNTFFDDVLRAKEFMLEEIRKGRHAIIMRNAF